MSTGAAFTFDNCILFSPQITYLTIPVMELWIHSGCYLLYLSYNYEELHVKYNQHSVRLSCHHFYSTHICRISNIQLHRVIFIHGDFTNQPSLNAWGPWKLQYKLFIKISIFSHLLAYTIC